jgi:hypothetical protein
MTTPTPVVDELAALRRIVTALEPLDPTTQARVVDWLVDRYGPDDNGGTWQDEARRFAENAGYWRDRAEAAEAKDPAGAS